MRVHGLSTAGHAGMGLPPLVPVGGPLGMGNHGPSRLGPRINQPLQLVLSQLQVGCIMGRAGANMSQIRQVSSARSVIGLAMASSMHIESLLLKRKPRTA